MGVIWESEPEALLLYESPVEDWNPMSVSVLGRNCKGAVWPEREDTWTWAWRTDWPEGQPPVLARQAELGEHAIALPRSAGPWPDIIPKLV